MHQSKLLAASVAIATVFGFATSASAATNLIINGDFEAAPAPPAGGYTQLFGGNSFPGWTVTGSDILLIDKNYVEGGTLVFNANSPNVAVDLTGAGNTSPLDGIVQNVMTTQAGQIYRLSFYVGNAAPIGGNGAVYTLPSTVNLSINSGAIQSFTNASTAGTGPGNGINFQLFSTTFAATGSSTSIAFSNGTAVGDNYAGLDDVALTAVPEPATWAMMILGFLGMGATLRQRRRALA